MKINKIALAISLVAASSLSHASLSGMNSNGLASFLIDVFEPNGTAYGGAYQAMNSSAPFTNMYGSSGSSGGGLLVTSATDTTGSNLVLGDPSDNRLYDSGYAQTFSFTAYHPGGGANSVDLQVKSYGNPDSVDSVSIVGAGSLTGQLFATSLGSSSIIDGDGNYIQTYSFDLGQTLAPHRMFTINYTTLGENRSYDAFGIVTNPVPVPAAAWLFGSALLGLAGLRRKK